VTFQWPLVLIALALVPLLAVAHLLRERRRDRYAARLGNPVLLPNLVDRSPGFRRHLPLAVLLVGLAALIVGLARPHASVTVRQQVATVILALDISRSMLAKDVPPTRLDASRRAAEAFVAKVPAKYRIGVVTFSTRAVTALPPTPDRSLVHDVLVSLHGGNGTALGDAIALAVQLGRRRAADGTLPPAAILLISDGTSTSGRITPATAVQRARMAHIPVYTAVVGTPNGTVTQMLTGGYREIIRVPPSPQTLQQVAESSGGEFFTALGDPRLQDVFRKLGTRLGHRTEDREITDVFAGGSALLLLAGGALSAFWFRKVP
jgi:Ca-activated chloride channel family protein